MSAGPPRDICQWREYEAITSRSWGVLTMVKGISQFAHSGCGAAPRRSSQGYATIIHPVSDLADEELDFHQEHALARLGTF
jgi:hypothetical protein